jgi:hypothetical protein
MKIQLEVTITLTDDYVEHSFYIGDGYIPTIKDIVHRAIEDIDCTHRFSVSYEAKNVVISDLDCRVQS